MKVDELNAKGIIYRAGEKNLQRIENSLALK